MRDDFAVFILSHGRPDNIITLRVLELAGYTGRTYIVIDDEDDTAPEYHKTHGDNVLVFNKAAAAKLTDTYDQDTSRHGVVFARNAVWEVARKTGVKYFIVLDDDYTAFSYRRFGKKPGADHEDYHGWKIKNLDRVLEAMVTFVETTPTDTLCMSQGGDHFGGKHGNIDVRLKRKAMNSFVCDVDRPFYFPGRINEDVNMYVSLGNVGRLFFTYMPLQLDQLDTQQNPGGLTEIYLDAGTYVKSFYSVMAAPSCVTVRTMGRTKRRLHHHINWRHAVPKIISPEHRKPARR